MIYKSLDTTVIINDDLIEIRNSMIERGRLVTRHMRDALNILYAIVAIGDSVPRDAIKDLEARLKKT